MITASLVAYNSDYNSLKKIVEEFFNADLISRFIVVDNSKNDSLRKIDSIKNVIYIFNNKNIGFGNGHNKAFKIANDLKSKFHFIINPDIIFKSNIISGMIKKANETDDLSLMMPKILYPDDKIQYLCKLLPTPKDLIFRRFLPFKKYLSALNYKYEIRFFSYDREIEPPCLSGCFLLINMKKLIQIGGFDHRFFMYMEDVDLCRRMGEVGRLIFYPKFSVIHEYQKDSYKSIKLLLIHIISSVKYFNKWGWIFDSNRKYINRNAIDKIKACD